MILRPPRSTLTDTLLPYTTLFRSPHIEMHQRREHPTQYRGHSCRVEPCREQWPNPVCAENPFRAEGEAQSATRRCSVDSAVGLYCRIHVIRQADMRSEERRVGIECVSRCRSLW